MIKRFSLYGFLKNQRYFEPFIILFFLQQGLSFTQIGILIGFRELLINIIEIPSGAVADLFGRRRSMILSFISYIISFAVFGFSTDYWHFFAAMSFFAIGEAFRTGTHKAMIFTWLRLQGRLDEKTKVYGYTRSWSKIGSVVSTILAVVFVLVTDNYSCVFFFAIVPYIMGLINFLSYPAELEGHQEKHVSVKRVLIHLWECMRSAVENVNLRRLIIESISFEGVYKAVDTYLQPILKNIALMLPIFILWGEAQRSSIIVGIVYIIIYFAAAYASRNAHRLVSFAGSEEACSRLLWKFNTVIYIALIPLLFFELYYVAVICFILLSLLQNFWYPVLLSRFDAFATEEKGATVLSIESQAKSLSTMIFAPLMGVLVDYIGANGPGGDFWPVAAIAVIPALYILATQRKRATA
ncbi:MAG TPA: MFS transporter [Dehalococcoidia bacterium]|nr:MFS transporter [Dehalococcoidia bacterium]HAS27768.1 MFS transporter [Dehalococcoidia bacterium]